MSEIRTLQPYGCTISNASFSQRRPFTVQKAVFGNAICGLLHGKRPHIVNMLNINTLQINNTLRRKKMPDSHQKHAEWQILSHKID